MSRQVQFEDQQVVLYLTGLISVGALKREVAIPYSSIKKVDVEDFKVNLLRFRIGTSIADIRQGRFLIGDRWCFISYENHHDVIVLELEGHEFGKVVFQVDNPEEIKDQIEAHLA